MDDAAPYGRRKDGTPKAKPGRKKRDPSKAAPLTPRGFIEDDKVVMMQRPQRKAFAEKLGIDPDKPFAVRAGHADPRPRPSVAKGVRTPKRDRGNGIELTDKQEAFAQAVADGHNYSDAYRQTHITDSTGKERIWHRAYTMASNPKIKERIELLILEKREEHRARQASRVPRIVATLEHIMANGATETAKLRAADQLAKLSGLYAKAGITDDKDDMTADEIAERLQSLIGGKQAGGQ